MGQGNSEEEEEAENHTPITYNPTVSPSFNTPIDNSYSEEHDNSRVALWIFSQPSSLSLQPAG